LSLLFSQPRRRSASIDHCLPWINNDSCSSCRSSSTVGFQ
jgi:hypothetical protein